MTVSRHLVAVPVVVIALTAAGCQGAVQQTTPRQWHGAGGIIPTQEDKDVGLVGIAPGFDIRRYTTILVDRCAVAEREIKDEEDRELARTLPDFFQAETVRQLSATGLFEHVVSLDDAPPPASPDRALRIECVLTRLAPGSLGARNLIVPVPNLFTIFTPLPIGGFGMGRTKAEVELRFVDVETGTVVMVTADRRESKSGAESEVLLRQSFDDMARDLAKFLVRLSKGRVPKN